MSGRSRVAVAGLLSTLAVAAPVRAQAPVPPGLAHAHLAGTFQLAGTVTVSDHIPGEHVGEHVLRTWKFLAPCPTGSCSTMTLVRDRAHGTDRLSLRRRAPAYYVGDGRFFAPLRCGQRTYSRGALVAFTITVRITATTVANGVELATRIYATYVNRRRINLTPCVSALGHDAAKYHGHLVA